MTELVALLLETGMAQDLHDAARLLAQGGVRVNGRFVTDPATPIQPGDLIRVGRTRAVVAVLHSETVT